MTHVGDVDQQFIGEAGSRWCGFPMLKTAAGCKSLRLIFTGSVGQVMVDIPTASGVKGQVDEDGGAVDEVVHQT